MNKLKALLGFDPKNYYGQDGVDSWYETTFLTMCYILAAGFGCFCSSIMFSVN